MSIYYNRSGQPITADQWSRSYTRENQRVAVTDVTDDVRVSTVWLGLDHRFGDGPPLIFETMIFGGPLDQEEWRYSTETEALAGHEAAVERARAALGAAAPAERDGEVGE